MKLEFWVIGKTAFDYLEEGIALYEKRLRNYVPFQFTVFPDIKNAKNMPSELLKSKEGELILNKLNSDDFLMLLDERGKQYSSVEFSTWIEQKLGSSHKRVVFLVGGAFGFSPDVYARANAQCSLSRMTFSHQMIRLFFIEQVYRAMTILKGEPYHNE
jgi:23S rRNA (pseudouridine1915-N3)-methyltransferase